MKRREFIALIGGAAAAVPFTARAQQPTKMKRVAFVSPSNKIGDIVASNSRYRSWFEELRLLGYVEGQNLVVERYSAEGRIDYFSQLARDVVNTHPDVIFVQSNLLVLAFKVATASIPIVATAGDPVIAGIVSSIAHPGGNITGVAVDAGFELLGKRLGLLLEAIPKPLNAKYLASQGNWKAPAGRMVQDAAKHLGITISGALLDGTIDEAQYRSVFAAMEQDRVDALMVSPELVNFSNDQLLVDLAAKSRIPTIYAYRETVALGGLMAYAPDWADTLRRAANAVGQILKGANPGDIPFYQATKFDLVINVKTARALGLFVAAAARRRGDRINSRLPELALSGHGLSGRRCPLLEVKRTSLSHEPMSGNDPSETSASISCCSSGAGFSPYQCTRFSFIRHDAVS